ncbi:adenosylcobinamide-GDP ribazoletransferase [Clostridium lacusfryxellense]|uniref:adenosylcobinamide-GDP ribazoletransferase n=1 Tax=Clostridium lacusfryxellense TaxID=205328 RepID=UPI001C0E0266|nr:adenosylcobinamide-GDP ribazoletransferase [Clostridium lacusfryxellense]MBU3110888.1 adenosylcobinamide-GDP ribazoletransferase [Clostridium lacusfryxellense]
MVKEYINDFLLFFQFFTRIPINKSLNCGQENFKRGSIFFPVVGLFIGVVQWLVYYGLMKVLPINITTVFIVIIPIIITGGLHVDGLGDTCDGFFSFKGDKYKIIEIMKDSTVGTYATIAVVFDMLVRYAAVSTVIGRNLPLILIATPIIARFSVVFISFIGKNAKETGSGNIFIGNIDVKRLVIAAFITIILGTLLIGFYKSAILMLSAILLSFLFNKFCESKITGLTGDTLGANNELVEILTMVLFIAVS